MTNESPMMTPVPPIEADKAQAFFHSLYIAARSPGYGDHHRAFVTSLLLRAQEAQLYRPETP